MHRVAAAVCCLVLTAGCSGGDDAAAPAPRPTSAKPSPSVSPTPPPSPRPTPVRTTPPAPPPAANPLTPVLADLQRFVERTHGLRFRAPVQPELLSPAAFAKRVSTTFATTPEAVAGDHTTLVALGLLDPATDLAREYDELFTGLVGGFYDPATDRLVIGGTRVTPRTRVILAHELTHALVDQHADLNRPALDERDDEARLGLNVLAEGDAERVETAYRATLSAAERASVRREAAARGADVPPVLRRLLAIPYDHGPGLVRSLLARGGVDRLRAAYASPPTTSEQFLHPEVFLRGEGPRGVAEPRADGTVVDRGVLGEVGLRLALAPQLGATRAARAAAGWGGDRYVSWTAGGRRCLRLSIVMDTEADLADLRSAFAAWPGTTVEPGAPLTVTRCR